MAKNVIDLETRKGDKKFTKLGIKSKNKDKKMLKRINKALDRIEKQVTKLHQISQKLRTLKEVYVKAAA